MLNEIVTVKGTPARSLQKFVDAELTAEQRDACLRSLPPEFAARFRIPILPTETIPVHLLNRVVEEAARARGEAADAFARRAGREAAGEAIRGIYRFFAMILTPAGLLSRAAPLWSTLYNRGEMRVVEQGETSARVRLVNFPSEAIGCARIAGWIERMAELTGVREIRVEETQCFTKGDPHCEWTIRWS